MMERRTSSRPIENAAQATASHRRCTRRALSVVLALTAVLLAACTNNANAGAVSANVVDSLSGSVDDGYARAYAPAPFTFPDDHGAHPQYQTEWWYYTGNLDDADGREYGYQLTFFRYSLTPEMPARESDWATNQVYMAHFALTDAQAEQHADFERFSRGSSGLAGAVVEPSWAVWLDDWRVETLEPGVYSLIAAAKTEDGAAAGINLILRETRPPLLHGDQGLSQKGPEPGNASYYYSLVGLDTTGKITRGGQTVDVFGASWMVHEYGTSALSEDATGWDWFSLQLDNGAALMLAQVRTADGGRLPEFKGTLASPDGSRFAIGASEFGLQALDEWTSRATGVTYPSGWRVTVPAHEIELTLTPLIRDQEMQTSYVYWEGAVHAEGEMDGRPTQGRGYVELTGYGGATGATLR